MDDIEKLCGAMPFMTGCSFWVQCTASGRGALALPGRREAAAERVAQRLRHLDRDCLMAKLAV